ncbi:tetratricopeptide repeat protein [Acanthopleuribacter pedis]|uniref:Tetratricopeptide repeat protein n=1 Tax=Acanthopleuribacter pedis TaxID=442870 RepID=A0A8J7QAE1_9BACT|nr:tetratricopeptide repeat protein [Acanthopleuribacter pedis]
MGHPDQADTAFSKVLEFAPDNPHALRGLGVIALEHKQFDQARNYFERLQIQEPADEKILEWLQQCDEGALQEEAERMAQDIDPTRTVEMTKGNREMLLGDISDTQAVPVDALPSPPSAPAYDPKDYATDPGEFDGSEEFEATEASDALDEIGDIDDLEDIDEDDLETLDDDDLEDLDEDDFLDEDAFELEEEDDLAATISDDVAGIPVETDESGSFDGLDDDLQPAAVFLPKDDPKPASSAFVEVTSESEPALVSEPETNVEAARFDTAGLADGEAAPTDVDDPLPAAAPFDAEAGDRTLADALVVAPSMTADEAAALGSDNAIESGLEALDAVAEEAERAAQEMEAEEDAFGFDLDPDASVDAEVTATLMAEGGETTDDEAMDAIDLHFERALSETDSGVLEEDLVVAARPAPADEPLMGDPLSSEEFESKMTKGLKHEKMEHFEQAEQIYRLLLRHRPGDGVVTGHLQRLLGVLAAESKKRKKIRKLSNWLDKIKGVYDVS